MKRLKFLFAIVLMAATPAFTACSSDGEDEDVVFDQEYTDFNNANIGKEGASYVKTEAGVKSAKFADRLEMPRLQQGDVFIVHQATDMEDNPVNFAVAYVPALHHSRWVAFRFDNAMKGRSVSRKDNSVRPQYPQDPFCKETPKSDASFNGYDHGHLCASADRLCSRMANDQTFYMSNMSPQLASFNKEYWTHYEMFVQELGYDCGTASGSKPSFADTLYVVKGGAIRDAVTTTKVENYYMPVPTHYFIALLSVKDGNYTSIGFWVEHGQHKINIFQSINKELAAHAVSIDQLEAYTGIDFFCNLPGAVEKAVEASCIPSAWGL